MHKKLQPKLLPPKTLQMKGISPRTMQEHDKLYEGYVNKVNETRKQLASIDVSKGNPSYSSVRELKRSAKALKDRSRFKIFG
ncbi:hypothetical protein CIG75_16720 [Tumebacillus algifaecis]|uniref:Uncharacterized protein n=1 Tax=Tumebacillus algifaecis TaxID=1214604 RepID=A0A223D4A2_9BACL|nr:hypothetical protein [Tumebacillus algifaecis]ASS76438.1 hypothetical protein CIG75_16720 [Tumebacillus algifaecis]